MRKHLATYVAVGCLLVSTTFVSAAPPARPLPISANQFAALRELEQQPEHQQVLETRATYQSEHEKVIEQTRQSDDILTAITYIGYPGAIAAILIAGLAF